MKDPKKVKQGKRDKAQGAQFELRVRKDLEEKGWVVDRWSNNVELGEMKFIRQEQPKLTKEKDRCKTFDTGEVYEQITKLIPSKVTWRRTPKGMFPMNLNSGFPDFIAFKPLYEKIPIIAVECKMTGKLDKLEKEKCKWLLDNNIFSKILIAEKTKVKNRIVIVYHDFTEKYGN